jgi:aminopeptidase N
MIHTLLGEQKYRKATDLYFEHFDAQAVTTNDFLWAMSEASGVDLTQFERWYHQNGTPKLCVKESFSDGVYSITLTQKIPDSIDGKKQKPYYYPLKMALIDKDGNEIVEKTLIISKDEEVFSFEGLDSKPVISINRDFSAPIIVEQQSSDFPFLMRYDSNSFLRYESAQTFAIEVLESMMRGEDIDKEFIKSYGYLLDLDIELSYKALLLELPSVSTLMQRQEVVDFEPIYKAKERLSKELASTYKEKLMNLYDLNHQPECSDIDSLSISKRAIKNCALELLSSLKSEDIIILSKKQYETSITMTDRVIALDILENISVEFATVAKDDFYNRYKDDTLVMNKYFSILASSKRDGTLSRVKELENDEVYDEKVPNLVRSLIGSFARNYKYFHAKDGSGYRYIADKIIEIDKINAQMGSGLAGAFKIYNKMNKINKKLMKIELDRVVSTHSLSKNTYEIVHKIL